ncbi:hypothetical protein A3F38_00410 [Candidatus Saccharibacteria bacterium RIFCSPHIGHO2_12_FULL_48_21]|nr:MAG: hypothetical protein A3F38_00410 [Candidatus Saccharibacteria bacterium RIFCSPHIGHO2_12_FULL_48_21]
MFSIITPLDPNRLEQFKVTKQVYDAMPQKKEFLIPTRNYGEVLEYLNEHGLNKDVKLFPYSVEEGFNVSKALNLATRNASFPQIIITSPEIKPLTPVLDELEKIIGTNVICKVYDENEKGKIVRTLVRTGKRSESPRMYFLAMFNKADVEKINGWDEDFLKGYAYEDDDFGARWNRTGLPFIVRDDIEAIHQYHPRSETIPNGLEINKKKLEENNANGVIRPKNGLNKL